MHGSGFISIWFFIGVLLTAYGILIFGTGLYELTAPPANPPVLFNLHASVWWGALLLAIGLFYAVKFRPKRQR
jgi:hypothetical protein